MKKNGGTYEEDTAYFIDFALHYIKFIFGTCR